MESKEANSIPIATILEEYGIVPDKSYYGYDMYKSPFREENNASFKVDVNTNRWQDFADGSWGSAVDLVMKLENCSFNEAMQLFAKNRFATNTHIIKKEREQVEENRNINKLHILKVAPLTNKILINYAFQRGISQDIIQAHCQEVYYKIGNEGKSCFALGFINNSGGMEIRNPMFKGCTHPKDATFIKNGNAKCAVFEGFFDYLSFLQFAKNTERPELTKLDAVILNSTTMLNKSLDFLKSHELLHCFLDNDLPGRSTYHSIVRIGISCVNESERLFPEQNDFNEFLIRDNKKKQQEHKQVEVNSPLRHISSVPATKKRIK